MKKVIKLFTEHPRLLGMSYFKHLRFAYTQIWKLQKMTWALSIHAIFPFWFTNYYTETMRTEAIRSHCKPNCYHDEWKPK